MSRTPSSFLSRLICPECEGEFDADALQTYCQGCDSPLLAQYDMEAVRNCLSRDEIARRPPGLWRWAELLPVRDPHRRLTLGEGSTPLLPIPRLGNLLGLPALYVKDEARNPTGTFKARGLCVAVSRGLELGVRSFVIPTAGNAGGALAAYAALAGCEAHIYMPRDAPELNQKEALTFGAQVRLVDGLIGDAGRLAAEEAAGNGWFNLATFREPYRVEGKKTMGFELAEDFDWQLPEVIIYPTGGGTGLVGMWKAFAEMETLGWINARRPRMVSVQAAGCAPVVRAIESGENHVLPWDQAQTVASGLRVSKPFAGRLILQVLRESQGTAVAVSDEEILQAQRQLARREGIFAAPEGAAPVAALSKLLGEGWIRPEERVLLFNTGTGLKYV